MSEFTRSSTCFETATMERYLADALPEPEELRVRAHLEECEDCRSALERAAAGPGLWHGLSAGLAEELAVPLDGEEDEEAATVRELSELLAPTDDPAMIGRVGHYEVCGLIGRGSTGIVLKALEPRLGRYVAIKLMSPVYKASGVARRRFEREGRAVAAVAHEHVVPIHAVDEHRGLPYIVMGYVAGQSLEERITGDGVLDTREVTRVGLQVAKALSAAHAQGIVHRDVKPANVILENTVDRAMVTDFGLAHVLDEASMTRSGTIAGTPQYMSPEQARGESIDGRADLFSLGSLMYAACTGVPPFRAQTVFGVIHRVCEVEPRPLREVNPEIRGWLASFIEKLMRKNPADRFASAEEVATHLGAELAYLQNPTAAPKPKREWMASPRAPKPGARVTTGWRNALLAVAGGAAMVLGLALLDGEGGADGSSSVQSASFSTDWPFASSPGQDGTESLLDGAMSTWTAIAEPDGEAAVYEHRLVQTLPAVAGEALRIRLDRGDVSLVATDSEDVTIEVARRLVAEDPDRAVELARRHELELVYDEGALELVGYFARDTQPFEGEEFAGIHITIAVPAGFHQNVVTLAGDVLVGELRSDVDVTTGSGSIESAFVDGAFDAVARGGGIRSAGCRGPADLLAVLGNIELSGVLSTARVRTSGGDVHLGKSTGEVTVQTGGGSVVVRGIAGPTMVYTSDGDVRVRLDENPLAMADFNANGGDVLIAVEDDVALQVETRGELESAFDHAVRELTDGEAWGVVQLNGGGATLRATSRTGRVCIASGAGSFDESFSEGSDGSGGLIDSDGPIGSGGPVGLNGSGPGSDGPTASGLSGSGPVGDGPSGLGLGGSGLGGSGLSGSGPGAGGPSGLGGSGSGGSGPAGLRSGARSPSALSLAKTMGEPRPGGLATVLLREPAGALDGYTLYLPVSHETSQGPYPILVYLQGAYGVGGAVSDLNNWGLLRLIRDEHQLDSERNHLLLDRFIVVSPHIQEGNYHDHPDALARILDGVIDDYAGDRERIYMTGLSRGAHGTWGLAARLPDTFAAIAPVGGHAHAVEDFERVLQPAIWVAHNDRDTVAPYEWSLQATRELEQLSGVPFLQIDPREVPDSDYLDHRYVLATGRSDSHDAWTQLYSSAEFYRWLLQHSLAPSEEGDPH